MGRNLVAHRKLRYFSITHRLRSIFMSSEIAEHMMLGINLLIVKLGSSLIGFILGFQ
jgi:hypothetical protein